MFEFSDINDNSSHLLLGINNGRLFLEVTENNVALVSVSTTTTINDGAWHHIAVTVGSGGNLLYIDGQVVSGANLTYSAGSSASTQFASSVTGLDAVVIGPTSTAVACSATLAGRIDETRLHNRALTSAELANVAGATLAYTENDAPTVVDSGLTVSDADNANLASATVTISAGFATGEDTLAFTNQNGITGSWNAGTGVLTLSGTATVANYPDSPAQHHLRQQQRQP